MQVIGFQDLGFKGFGVRLSRVNKKVGENLLKQCTVGQCIMHLVKV